MASPQEWLHSIYGKYYKKVWRTSYYLLGDYDLAEDIAQTAFLILLTKYDAMKYRERDIYGWLLKAVRNLVMNESQKAYRTREVPLKPEHEHMVEDDNSPDFMSLLPAGLTERERKLLYLYIEAGFSHEETAARLGCTPEACRMRLYRAKAHCKKLLLQTNVPNFHQ